jgi:hypothetical protein
MHIEVFSPPGTKLEFHEKIVLDSRKEQEEWFVACCDRVLNDTRWVLDNLEKLPEFQVDWENYHKDGYVRPSRRVDEKEKGL